MSTNNAGWIGVDLDGTLAKYDGWKGPTHVGEPIKLMVDRVKTWIDNGVDVRIVTARVSQQALELNKVYRHEVESVIARWCILHIGRVLTVTSEKDLNMIELWDDRAVQVIPNTGLRVDGNR